MRLGKRRWIEIAVVVGAATLFTLAVLPRPLSGPDDDTAIASTLPLDDAYIFIRFAQQAARGRILEWTDGVPSSGATSLVHLALVLPGQLGDGLAAWVGWSRFVGWLSLIALGLAGARLLRAIGLDGLVPAVGGSTLVLAGPIGWGALAGMESATNAAAVLFACALAVEIGALGRQAGRGRLVTALLVIGCLPLVRPENALLVVAAVPFAWAAPALSSRRSLALLLLVPGALLAALDYRLTGILAPAGVMAKSITEFPFADPSLLADLYGLNLIAKVAPVYLGARSGILWPPVGWITLAVALAWPLAWLRSRIRRSGADRPWPNRFAVPVACWWVFFLAAPMSAMVEWQYMRHHHAGLALAWTLSIAAAALGLERLGRPAVSLLALAPVLLLAALPLWRGAYAAGASDLLERHGRAGEWLDRLEGEQVLLLNDAGYLAVRYDGPMIDALGLGTPAMARSYRHGPGATLEALARQPRRPHLAAVNRDVLHLEPLLGRPLGPAPRRPADTFVAEVSWQRLEGTALSGDGLDFAALEEEATVGAAWGLDWQPPPDTRTPSRLVLYDRGGQETLQGCRPLRRALELELPAGRGAVVLIFGPPTAGGEVVAKDGDGAELGRTLVPAGDWRRLTLPVERGASRLRLERVSAGIPCLESIRLLP